jgi:hypothetical protein
MPDPVLNKKADRFWSALLATAGTGILCSCFRSRLRRNQQQQGLERHSVSALPKKRTGFGPHFSPRWAPEFSVLASAAGCAETNGSKARSITRSARCRKKRTGFGPHLSPLRAPDLPSTMTGSAQRPAHSKRLRDCGRASRRANSRGSERAWECLSDVLCQARRHHRLRRLPALDRRKKPDRFWSAPMSTDTRSLRQSLGGMSGVLTLELKS